MFEISAQAKILDALRPRVAWSMDKILDVWGPVITTQYDCDGITPLQKYLTLLVNCEGGRWFIVRRVDNVRRGEDWPSPPFCFEIRVAEALQWLQNQGLEVPSAVMAATGSARPSSR